MRLNDWISTPNSSRLFQLGHLRKITLGHGTVPRASAQWRAEAFRQQVGNHEGHQQEHQVRVSATP
jgi:hypothetical protein